ncbi:MarR family winged helix-turn-helix transcriptional regulator [Amycolatopsis sp. CA-230715]|uniref:MarR family winged helix-turn-helix transcriptional regulator n=1 Tax=Amycolatopsis sp. CA-230715 TaxID=2745196 RepID=UPI001C022D28|nr:MarR family transcriptional regulator [Amycolatopsis sp. CA-230715]QWF80719.1 hypothetical protein HUW46_04143 [Amycolatopsis sp. CA-230715]
MSEPAALIGELIRLSTPVGRTLAGELGVSVNDLAALHHLVGRTPLGPAELGRRLGMSTASATALVDRLERGGYLRRRPDPRDRRRIVLEATEAIAERSMAAIAPLAEAVAAIPLDDDAREAVTSYLDEVLAAMRSFAEGTALPDRT